MTDYAELHKSIAHVVINWLDNRATPEQKHAVIKGWKRITQERDNLEEYLKWVTLFVRDSGIITAIEKSSAWDQITNKDIVEGVEQAFKEYLK